MNKGGAVSESGLTENAVWWIVRGYAGRMIYAGPVPACAASPAGALEQIQLLLGHASTQTTMDYLGTKQNLAEAVNDRLGLID